jgi:hypothetical protein
MNVHISCNIILIAEHVLVLLVVPGVSLLVIRHQPAPWL